jgi:hypothetical protein
MGSIREKERQFARGIHSVWEIQPETRGDDGCVFARAVCEKNLVR